MIAVSHTNEFDECLWIARVSTSPAALFRLTAIYHIMPHKRIRRERPNKHTASRSATLITTEARLLCLQENDWQDATLCSWISIIHSLLKLLPRFALRTASIGYGMDSSML